MPTPILFGKVLLISKDQSEHHFLSCPGSVHTRSRILSLAWVHAHTHTLLPHAQMCSALHTHKHTAPTMAASPISLLIRPLCIRQRPRKWRRSCQPRFAGLMGISGTFGLGQSWHHCLHYKTQEWENQACLSAPIFQGHQQGRGRATARAHFQTPRLQLRPTTHHPWSLQSQETQKEEALWLQPRAGGSLDPRFRFRVGQQNSTSLLQLSQIRCVARRLCLLPGLGPGNKSLSSIMFQSSRL